ncbi:MAG: hypothetical protein H7X92_08170 [Chitinophagales bacterium]|nr:hypothetical protein [Hyphomicrobiales bacterium]
MSLYTMRIGAALLSCAILATSITGASAFSPLAGKTPNLSGASEQGLVTPVRRRHRRNLGLGILGGVAAAVIINEAAKADDGRYDEGDVVEARRCRRLHFRCKDGDAIACDRFDDYC